MSDESRAAGRKSSKRVGLVTLLVMLALAALAPGAKAYSVCTEYYIGGCLNNVRCDYYDNETGRSTGSVNVNYHCPRVY